MLNWKKERKNKKVALSIFFYRFIYLFETERKSGGGSTKGERASPADFLLS